MRHRNTDVIPSTVTSPRPIGRAPRSAFRLAVAVVSMLATLLAANVALAANALIHGSTVTGSPSQEEQIAAAAGYTVTVVDDATWQAMTAADFGGYDLLIIGDDTCTSEPQQAAANAATWAPVVMGTAGGRTKAGNRIVVGTDPVFHDGGDPNGLRATIIREGIGFAGAQPGTTGLYFCASCGGGGGNVLNALTLLSTGTGTWTDNSFPPCGGAVSLIAAHPSFPTLSTASLEGWGCSVHESWPTFPSDWSALAVATDTPTLPTCGIDPNTGLSACGEAYILVAGSSIVVISESIAIDPLDASNPVGTSHTVTATVTADGAPLAGQLVDFTVTGVNAGATGTCVPADCKTDVNGQVTFTYTDANGPGDDTIKASFTDSAGSLQAATAQKHWIADPTGCGCMDIAFIIDDTGSMAGAIGNVQSGFTSIITNALAASGGDLRMSVLSFADTVDVDQGMTTVVADVQTAINALVASGGGGTAEASDQGLRVAVTDTSTCGPTAAHGAFRPDCIKIAIMVTDATPGGCDDNFTPGVDDLEAAAVATLAAAGGIKISAIQVLDGFQEAIEAPIMLNYATTTGGTFTTTPSNGAGAENAINAIIDGCGTPVVCGDNVVSPPGEECDGTSDSACPGDCRPPGDPNECTCDTGPECGDGTVDPGETCDPPGDPAGASGQLCRANCTVCGDGVLQSGETCDDGNNLQCDPIHPQKELDDCNNICGINICDDPARLAIRPDGLDVLRHHGIMVAPGGAPIELTGNLTISITTSQGTVFKATVPADAITVQSNGNLRYRNSAAKTAGGLYSLRATRDRRTGNYKMSAIAYGEAIAPMGDMVTHVLIGGREWSVRGLWRDHGRRWVFTDFPTP